MNVMRFTILFTFLLIGFIGVKGQINFLYTVGGNLRTIDGLSNVRIMSGITGNTSGTVNINVAERGTSTQVLKIVIRVELNQGMNVLSTAAFAQAQVRFSPTPAARLINQTRNFPPGSYDICYAFIPDNKQLAPAENCFDVEILPMSPLQLSTPAHYDTLCQKRPFLAWQPPLPVQPGTKFRLLLVEKTHPESVESIYSNAPLILLDNISAHHLNFPSGYPDLVEGKTYAWQVAAHKDGVIISTSEVWEFTVQCVEEAPVVPRESYRELKYLSNANFYIANRFLQFSFNNEYNSSKLRYAIYDLAQAGKMIKKLPEIKLKAGLNLVDMDLTQSGLTAGNIYMLRVFPFNEPVIEIKFTYTENE